MKEVDAILEFDTQRLKEILSKGLAGANQEFEGQSLLVWACSVGNEEAAVFLLDNGADYDVHGQRNETPLMLASYSGMDRFTSKLLSHAVKLDTVDSLGRDALMFAAKGGHASIVRMLCAAGALPSRTDAAGRSSLQWALVEDDHAEVVESLIECCPGAINSSIKDAALHYAKELGRHQSEKVIAASLIG
ncbi:ankyrin repeat domain-containing protein [Rhizobacter sp. SG703]|uniref:ankyrin repeat domain-containing protein n=1 Tax=Rhizobacter sp. SG703 TaxID=2587140 RepID=UPI001446E5CF|nr:ankyrin repeat protein [Rhizobacter sp. SG703]